MCPCIRGFLVHVNIMTNQTHIVKSRKEIVMERIIHEEAVVLLRLADSFLEALYDAPPFERMASNKYRIALTGLQSAVYNMKRKLK